MNRRHPQVRRIVCVLLITEMLVGCYPRTHPIFYLPKLGRSAEEAVETEEDYYVGVATEIEYADVDEPTPDTVAFSKKPRTLRNRVTTDEIWDMTLAEAIHLALANNKIIRRNDRASLQVDSSSPMSSPDTLPSMWDPAIQESGVLFGNRGVESALSAFDAQLAGSMLWGKNEIVQNNFFSSGGLPAGGVLVNNTGAFTSSLSKVTGTGGQFQLTNNWNYLQNNLTTNLFPSIFTGNVGASFTHPILAGAGREYVGTAGPLGTNIQGVSGVNQGVSIARINTDISLADFEFNVTNMLFDTEKLYWDLYYAYRQYDDLVVNFQSAFRAWREAKARMDVGAKGGGAADEALARETLLERRSAMENALANIDFQEVSLRRMCNLPMNDGRIIRPANEPVNAEFVPDWYTCLAEALTRRVELRRQKWNIKSLDLQLRAARSQTMPQLNFVSAYQYNGFGDTLWSYREEDFKTKGQNLHSAITNLIYGGNNGWTLGFNFQAPVGFRAALAQVRNLELRLARAREVLNVQEQEISFELAGAFQDLTTNFVTAQTNFNRRRAAEAEVQAFTAEYHAGTQTLTFLLQAQARQADAENAYYNSIVNYTKSIAHINYRKGTLLELNNVHLSEGEWSPEAYQDALRQAWARVNALPTNEKHSEPNEFGFPDVMGSAEFGVDGEAFREPEGPLPDYPAGINVVPQMPPPPSKMPSDQPVPTVEPLPKPDESTALGNDEDRETASE